MGQSDSNRVRGHAALACEQRRAALSLVVAVWLVAVLAGCGGGETAPPAAPARKAAPAESVPPVPVRKARAAPDRFADFDGSLSPPPGAAARPSVDPAADPRDVFVVLEQPNFEIVTTPPGVHPSDVFYANAPAPGHDSSTFIVIDEAVTAAPTARTADPDFKLPAGFVAIGEAGYSEAGWPRRIRCAADDAEMALVPAGVALIGTVDGPPETTPQLSVYLDAFYIDVTEVTVARYGRYLAARRGTVVRTLEQPLNRDAPAEFPVLGVSWGAARDYAHWAGKELPTEAQWEKAARGPTAFEHPWGHGRALFGRTRTPAQIDPAGSFPLDRSPFGAFDMAGNAREWCLDFYSDRAFQEAAGADAVLSNWSGPRRPSSESLRVIKGNGPDWKVWHRSGLSMRERRPDVGFRCVLTIPAADPAQARSEDEPAVPRGSRGTATAPASGPGGRPPRGR